MGERVSMVRVRRLTTTGIAEELEEPVILDRRFHLYLNGKHVGSFYTLPEGLEDLATGFLIGQGLMATVDGLKLKVEGDRIMAEGSLAEPTVPSVRSGYRIGIKAILDMVKRVEEMSELFGKTGGAHSAALFEDEKLASFSEDVSRRGAVDRVIGNAMRLGIDLSRCVLVSTGRQSGDMILKAARVGIPIVASKAAPTHSGVSTAISTGLTLVCFARGNRANVYSHPWRIGPSS